MMPEHHKVRDACRRRSFVVEYFGGDSRGVYCARERFIHKFRIAITLFTLQRPGIQRARLAGANTL